MRQGKVESSEILLEWCEAPWDSKVLGNTVLQITNIEIRNKASHDCMIEFERLRDTMDTGLVSCRLHHSKLSESMLLESHDFKFIEMVCLPELALPTSEQLYTDSELILCDATSADLQQIGDIAGTAFVNERFKIDPRINSEVSDTRYTNWAASCLDHPTQQLYVVKNGAEVVSFFVTEMTPGNTCYWHLNAIATHCQGNGYGKKVWSIMIEHAQQAGAKRVQTCISLRNNRVLNLYSRLNFYFPPPLMTFHWVAEP